MLESCRETGKGGIRFSRMMKDCRLHLSLFLFFILLFCLFPGIDLFISGLFYDEKKRFFLSGNRLVRFFYHSVPYSLVCFAIFTGWLSIRKTNRISIGLRKIGYLILVVLIGPGFFVNVLLKENMGRARPRNVVQFGGESEFKGAFIPSDQCAGNCSFPSGHAAIGFYFSSIAFVFRPICRPFWFTGMGYGFLVALGRVVQGGHFFSDVLFSYFIDFFVARILWWLIRDYLE